MLAKRIIPCLDVNDGRVVKGIRFVSLVDAGDPVEQGRRYDSEGADELTFLDITASSDKRAIVAGLVRRVADEVFIPFTVGGGLNSVEDVRAILRAGADKVSLNTAAVRQPDLTRAVSAAVSIPVIASGGAGTLEHFYEALTAGGASAVLAASLFHFGQYKIGEVKDYLRARGVTVR